MSDVTMRGGGGMGMGQEAPGSVAGLRLRPVSAGDADFLWTMLYYASSSDAEAGTTLADLRTDPDLYGYVVGWGRPGDGGIIGESGGRALGAAWLRLPEARVEADPTYLDKHTPWLAVAVLPQARGRGVGTAMLRCLLESARALHPAVVLTVRKSNPALRLYERLGFLSVGEVTNRVGTTSLKMVLTFPR